MAELRGRDSLSARALELTILCGTRTSETIGATWGEIDLKAKIWTMPAERMKAGKEHRIPLSDRAVETLSSLPRHGKRVFPLCNMAMLEMLRGIRPGATTHGYRSSFRTWSSERPASRMRSASRRWHTRSATRSSARIGAATCSRNGPP